MGQATTSNGLKGAFPPPLLLLLLHPAGGWPNGGVVSVTADAVAERRGKTCRSLPTVN